MAQFLDFTAPTVAVAVRNKIRAEFGLWDENDQYIEPDVEQVRAWAIDTANNWAGQQRSRYVTDIPFQASVYQEKEKEALRCVGDSVPKAENYPYCEIERQIIENATGQKTDLHTAAQFIAQVAADKRAHSVEIEAKRRAIGARVQAAKTVGEIETILAGLEL